LVKIHKEEIEQKAENMKDRKSFPDLGSLRYLGFRIETKRCCGKETANAVLHGTAQKCVLIEFGWTQGSRGFKDICV
jgi:hypothetical protein